MKRRKKKNINKTRYGDYSTNTLDYDEKSVHLIIYGFVSILLLIYAIFSAISGEIVLPRRFGKPIHINGISMYIIISSIISMIIGFSIPIIEFYARKKDFHNRNLISKKCYKIKKTSKFISWRLFIISILVAIINHDFIK